MLISCYAVCSYGVCGCVELKTALSAVKISYNGVFAAFSQKNAKKMRNELDKNENWCILNAVSPKDGMVD